MHRRTFIQLGLACLGGAGLVRGDEVSGESLRKWRVGVIGHTGRGNYGHGLDTVWKSVQGADIVGLADADDRGRRSAADRLGLGVNQVFSDYLSMIRMTRPEVITIGPRHADQHEAMCLAAIENGVRGIYIEKPFCRTPAEADRILAAAENRSVALAVAHRNRYHQLCWMFRSVWNQGNLAGFWRSAAGGKEIIGGELKTYGFLELIYST
ncbi:MAG: Gfo/Idh/MocA family oxidoreductase [Verrucomicrobia bacterium]|nr:Gfo/Idh/MocA family oxidoreductase [Verrucomicrobiota bacterium]